MDLLSPVTLEGAYGRLELLSLDHSEALKEASAEGELWKTWYTNIPHPDKVEAEIERRLGLHAKGSMLPFVIIDKAAAKPVGMTSYMNIDLANVRVEIGHTWYAKSVQRTGLNTDCKRLLLTHAFEMLGCIAVELRTHSMNFQSRRAIERLGAKLDGVLRQHMRMPNGTIRDTCVYSITAAEWPTVKANLEWLQGRGGR